MEQLACSVVLVAGGKSRRLGRDKVLLPWPEPKDAAPGADPGPLRGTLLGATLSRLANLSDDLIVVGRAFPAVPLFRNVPDNVPDAGPLAGIEAGLAAARYPRALTLAADMPFLNLDLLRALVELAEREHWDAVVPRLAEDPDPLHAVYSKNCLSAIRAALAAGQRRMIAFLPAVRVRYVDAAELRRYDPELRSLWNINTPEDLEQAMKHASG
jgi:molybdopterin-guanine dinucleotide biosynthesis protein A